MSEQVEKRLLELLDHPTHSPYGNPIPGLDQLGDQPVPTNFSDGVVNLVNFLLGAVGPLRGTVRRLGEPVQYEPDLLEQLQGAGIVPDARGEFSTSGEYTVVQMDGAAEALELPVEIAQHIYVDIKSG